MEEEANEAAEIAPGGGGPRSLLLSHAHAAATYSSRSPRRRAAAALSPWRRCRSAPSPRAALSRPPIQPSTSAPTAVSYSFSASPFNRTLEARPYFSRLRGEHLERMGREETCVGRGRREKEERDCDRRGQTTRGRRRARRVICIRASSAIDGGRSLPAPPEAPRPWESLRAPTSLSLLPPRALSFGVAQLSAVADKSREIRGRRLETATREH